MAKPDYADAMELALSVAKSRLVKQYLPVGDAIALLLYACWEDSGGNYSESMDTLKEIILELAEVYKEGVQN